MQEYCNLRGGDMKRQLHWYKVCVTPGLFDLHDLLPHRSEDDDTHICISNLIQSHTRPTTEHSAFGEPAINVSNYTLPLIPTSTHQDRSDLKAAAL